MHRITDGSYVLYLSYLYLLIHFFLFQIFLIIFFSSNFVQFTLFVRIILSYHCVKKLSYYEKMCKKYIFLFLFLLYIFNLFLNCIDQKFSHKFTLFFLFFDFRLFEFPCTQLKKILKLKNGLVDKPHF